MIHTSIGTSAVDWAGKSYSTIRTIGDRDGSLLIVPVGSVEQHGHHLPVATDTILVDAMAHAGAEHIDDDVPVLVTPTVWCGFSPHHLSLGGTLSLNFEHLRSVLEDVGRTGLQNGFDAVMFLNGHGGNISLINAVVSTLGQRTEAEVLGTTYFYLANDEVSSIRESDVGGMAHGGEFETSLMLYLREQLVGEITENSATPWDEHYEWAGQDLLDGGSLGVYREFEEYSATGAIGDPQLASAEKGSKLYDAIATELAALFVAIHEYNA